MSLDEKTSFSLYNKSSTREKHPVLYEELQNGKQPIWLREKTPHLPLVRVGQSAR